MRKMLNLMIAIVLGMAFILMEHSVQAAVVEVEVTIKSVNPQARGISVVYETNLGQKTIELDVSRKAEITVNGKEGGLDSLKPGQKAKITYEKELQVVTKIEATGQAKAAAEEPELAEVSELNDEGNISHPWPSRDGLTIYWTRGVGGKGTVWTAHRDDPQATFKDKRSLFNGRCPTVSSDGLEMIFLGSRTDGEEGMSLYCATRTAVDKPFGRPKEIPELAGRNCWAPCLSGDGLTLYFLATASRKDQITLCCTRKERSASWTRPKGFTDLDFDSGSVAVSFSTADGLTMFGHQNRDQRNILAICSRSAPSKPFEEPKAIEVRKHLVVGVWPRYVEASHEIFFAGQAPLRDGPLSQNTPISIWVIKNVVLPR